MVIQDIALFKGFIEGCTLREIFIRGYRKSAHFSNNPASIEEYLAKVDAEDVIKKGITMFSTNQTFGFDFWQNTNENWIIKLNHGRMNKSYNDYNKLITLEGMFKVLRENWDAAKSWVYEDIDKALKRLGLQEDLAESQSESEERKEGKEEVEETTSNEPVKEKDFFGVPEFDEEFEFFELNAGSRTRTNKLKKNECSLNFRSHSFKLLINQDITRKIKANMYKYVRLGKTKSGDIILQLHKEESVRPVNVTYNNCRGENAVNACINSKDLCEKLKVLLNLTGDYFVLHIEELSYDSDKATYKIKKTLKQ